MICLSSGGFQRKKGKQKTKKQNKDKNSSNIKKTYRVIIKYLYVD